MKRGMQVWVERPSFTQRGVRLAFFQGFPDGTGEVVTGFTVEKREQGEEYAPPDEGMVRLDDMAAQLLMDDLWRMGYRPTSEGTEGQAAAMRGHLNDMRAIVSKLANVDLR